MLFLTSGHRDHIPTFNIKLLTTTTPTVDSNVHVWYTMTIHRSPQWHIFHITHTQLGKLYEINL